MSRFNPEMSRDTYRVDYELTGRAGDPYRFTLTFDINGQHLAIDDMSMGDMQALNRNIARAIKDARHAKQAQDKETSR